MATRILLVLIFLLTQSCNKNPVNSSSHYKEMAHGYWEAVGGDTSVSNEIGLIVYNWYAIDTKSHSDTVYVTWDDGLACTKTSAMIRENTIEMSVFGVKAKFMIKNENQASVTFDTNSALYEKQILKLRNDPRVLCD